ncbi:YeeE/YedE family protein [Nannocystis sp.]|uniref:YeeE/YedE family protein n=1 Tax=Nannocystis sp. TaxID=1962667 RepID=UPI0024276F8E|nr:YeeE/YedE family protein [Nannocystis sp.]MBK7830293.1 YeeE/YedE family protein [Nannocystis sp.]MBK9752264.1 YeeE/YedE family protein [Nannocystis sp.]
MSLDILLPLLGGLLIGASALLLLGVSGRIAGVSGIVGGLMLAPRGDRSWRLAFLGGLMVGGLLLLGIDPAALPDGLPATTPIVVLAGFLVGYGARAANGCTSGHGVCGLGRRSRRSLVAVLVFMGAGVITAQLVRPLLGGAL